MSFIRSFIGEVGIKEVRLEEKIELTSEKIDFIKQFSYEMVIEELRRDAPIDGTEVVEWMHLSGAANILGDRLAPRIKAVTKTYFKWVSGDPYIPGVYNDEYSVQRMLGRTADEARVLRNGTTILTVPPGEKRISRNLEVQGLYRWRGRIQWTFDLIKNKIPKLPITDSIPIPAVRAPAAGEGMYMAPYFPVTFTLIRPALITRFWMTFSTENPTKINIVFLDASYREIGSTTIDLSPGTSTYIVTAGVPRKGYIVIDPVTSRELRTITIDSIKTWPITI